MPTQPGPDPGKSCRRVLVVEDDKDSREMLRILLELDGHDVHEAEDGPGRSRPCAPCSPTSPSSTWACPASTVTRWPGSSARPRRAARILLVALTGYAAPEDRERSRQAGFDAHLTKPIRPEKLGELFRMLEAPRPHP